MCWFADWVTLLSARCKYKILLHVVDIIELFYVFVFV